MTCSSLIVTWRAVAVLDDDQTETERMALDTPSPQLARETA
jgi:hypothetical protein